ncbi:hypothetical protein ACLH0K_01105 [Arthrobacter sp. MPF02]|uniref:hypothetical protein n=1 Tax=Arthrobacter sp. MPF02 TaxID=3388492 RepID=UPI0039847D7C
MADLQHAARALLQQQDVALIDLWILYWNHGGRCHPFEFDAYIHNVLVATWFDTDALAVALGEIALVTAG